MALGILAIGAIWLWSSRGSRQAPGNAELREPTVTPVLTPSSVASEPAPAERRDAAADKREWGISPLEPLSIRTADFADVPALDQPMLTHADPVDFSLDSSRATGVPRFSEVTESPAATPTSRPARASSPARSAPVPLEHTVEVELMPVEPPTMVLEEDAPFEETWAAPPGPESLVAEPLTPEPPKAEQSRAEVAKADSSRPARARVEPAAQPSPSVRANTEHSDRHAAVASSPNLSEKQKIVTVRVCAVGDARWAGADLMSALESLGLAYGRYQVYHRKHTDGRTIFCVASLVEPGTFDLSTMADEEFRGVSLFAILPGPLEPMAAVEALLGTARELARSLSGTMQDAKGMPFSPQRTEALLQDVARFQALLA